MSDEPDRKTGGRLGGTRPGGTVDPTRPPSRVDPGKRRLDRPVSVALAMRDPVERSTLAKALIQARCTVTMINSPEEAASADLADAEVLVADFDAPDVFKIVEVIRRTREDLPALAWTSRRAIVERGLSVMGFERAEALDRTARIPELVEAVQRLAGA